MARQRVLRVDMENCTGCQACVVACSTAKAGVCSKALSRISIDKIEEKCLAIPIICEHCDNPSCQNVCPVEAISKSDKTGIVEVDLDRCTGCKRCTEACLFSPETIKIQNGKAVLCDLCDGRPACVEICQPKALQYVTATKAVIRKKLELAKKRAKALSELRSGIIAVM